MGLYGSKDQHPKLVGTSEGNEHLASLQWQYCERCGNKHLAQYKKCPACGRHHKQKMGIVGKCWACIAIVVCVVVVTVYSGVDCPTSGNPSYPYRFVSTKSELPTRNATSTKTEKAPDTAHVMTMGQKNALNSAKMYLGFSNFSYDGLIKQLEFEKYTHEEAQFAADNCGADWFEQAAGSAKNYLSFYSFSKEGLIEQLEFEGYTREQAEYAVAKNGYQ